MREIFLTTSNRERIKLIPETSAEEEKLIRFAEEISIDIEGECCCKQVTLRLIKPVICGGRKVKERELDIVFPRK